jgi:hypothetical protein
MHVFLWKVFKALTFSAEDTVEALLDYHRSIRDDTSKTAG